MGKNELKESWLIVNNSRKNFCLLVKIFYIKFKTYFLLYLRILLVLLKLFRRKVIFVLPKLLVRVISCSLMS